MSARDRPSVRSGKFSNCLASVLVSHAASAVLLAAGSSSGGGQRDRRGAFLSCIISRDPMGARSWSERRHQAPPAQPPGPNSHKPALDISTLYNTATVHERQRLESGAVRDRQVRLQSVQTDLLLDLPHPVALPVSEGPCDVKILHLRGTEEVYRSYVRPPPNRTIWPGGCPPPPPPYYPQRPDSNSRPHRSSYPPGATSATEFSDPPPCYSDVIASPPHYHRTSAGGRNAQKSEL